MVKLALIFSFFSTFSLFGLILTVQFVYYPSFKWIESENFEEFHLFHVRSISLLVVPLMSLELFSSFYLLVSGAHNSWVGTNFILAISVWAFTFLVSMPCHKQLKNGKDPQVIQRLIGTNWFRTCLWLLKSLLLLYVLQGNLI